MARKGFVVLSGSAGTGSQSFSYDLLHRVTGSSISAFIGGLAFAFAPFTGEHVSHIQMLMAFGMPERPAGAVVGVATDWIRRQHGKWFAWVHVFDPHAPYRPPAPFDAGTPQH